jgi:hypothetical protein
MAASRFGEPWFEDPIDERTNRRQESWMVVVVPPGQLGEDGVGSGHGVGLVADVTASTRKSTSEISR